MKNIKIDLHLHSPVSRSNGDSIKWDSWYDSISSLKNNGIKIAAFSDHNRFDSKYYLEGFDLAKSAGILLLPAIEANVVRTDGIIANLIYVFDANLPLEKLNLISEIAKLKLHKRGISLSESMLIFQDFETIKIPHVGKSDYFKSADLKQIDYDAIEITNEKHFNYLAVLKEGIKTSVVAFSDTHIWKSYPQQNKLITVIDKIDEISFNHLKQVFKNNKNYTKRRF